MFWLFENGYENDEWEMLGPLHHRRRVHADLAFIVFPSRFPAYSTLRTRIRR